MRDHLEVIAIFGIIDDIAIKTHIRFDVSGDGGKGLARAACFTPVFYSTC